ncbi:hypothetical protein [Lewinella sp. JB7]|uniref:hypothetical protein n=1 Tax=Lewinella sp. JB7 TaxID=2962887 RepID=UPI0020CA0294|nr:hypothetical protein [Lewinella sp. JB7]MCP9235257.1 hypothetical protein [Lewinella sp. JB7]
MNRILLLLLSFLIFLISPALWGQGTPVDDREAIAPYSASRMAATYFGIEFSRGQRDSLAGRPIELIMTVDTSGRAHLQETYNVTNPAIIDSLRQRTLTLPRFDPAISAGRPRETLYILSLTYPTYSSVPLGSYQPMSASYYRPKREDFESLNRSVERFDMLVGGAVNQFIGKPSRYLAFGGGMRIDMAYVDQKARAYGLFMSVYGNKQRAPYPITTNRELNEAPPTLLVGLLYGRYLGDYLVQGEVGFAQQNLSPSLSDHDRDWLRNEGATLGLGVNRTFALGPGSFDYLYGSPTVSAGHINLHLSVHYQAYKLAEASGLMLELGVGYRWSMFGVESYVLKEQ